MEITETLYVRDRGEWRGWLKKHHASKKEVWLIYYKKRTSKRGIPYDDTVEEAICYGWIDGTVKRIDDERYCRRFTPRNRKSIWSDSNIIRLRKMLDAGLMTHAGLDIVPPEVMEAALSGRIERKGPVIPEVLKTPPDLEEALLGDRAAFKNWERLAPSRRKMYVYWVTDAKRPETRARRISRVVQYARENRKTMM